MVATNQTTLIHLYEFLLTEWDLYEDTRYGDRIDECLCWIETMLLDKRGQDPLILGPGMLDAFNAPWKTNLSRWNSLSRSEVVSVPPHLIGIRKGDILNAVRHYWNG